MGRRSVFTIGHPCRHADGKAFPLCEVGSLMVALGFAANPNARFHWRLDGTG